MGTAPIQGPLWGAHARDWAEVQEGTLRPAYLAIFDALGVGPGTRLLDVGCGARSPRCWRTASGRTVVSRCRMRWRAICRSASYSMREVSEA